MKRIVAPILLILMMAQAFSKWITIAEFNIYRSYIARNLCENRFRPQMHCNGKCVLMKKMAAEENQSAPAGNIKLSWETFLFIDNHIEYTGKNSHSIGNLAGSRRCYFLSTPFVPGVFRPPLA
jgi:hypothetical protein